MWLFCQNLWAGVGLENRIDEFGIYATALGMAKAYTAEAKGVSALYYNPAGVGLIKRNAVNLFFNRYFDSDAGLNFVGANFWVKKYPVALGLARYIVDNIPIRDEFGYTRGYSSADEINLRLGTSTRLKKSFFGGAMLEIQRNSYNNNVSAGAGLGLGLMYYPRDNRLLNIENFTANARTQLDAIVDVLFKELKDAMDKGDTTEIRNRIKNIIRIDPEHRQTRKLFKKVFGEAGKLSAEEVLESMDPYVGLKYELATFVKSEVANDTVLNKWYIRGFEYYNRGELYAAIKCWEAVRTVLQRNRWRNKVSAGLFMKNILGPRVSGDKYPFKTQLGVAYAVLPNKLRLELDMNLGKSVTNFIQAGGEFLPTKQFSIRLGAGDGLYLGFGVTLKNFNLNYVYRPFELGGYHMVDMNYYFGRTLFEKAFTFMQLGRLAMDNEDYFNAEKNFKRCLEIDPSFTIAYYYLQKVSERVKSARTKVKELIAQAKAAAKKEDYLTAVYLLETAVKINPENGEAVALLEKFKTKKQYFEKQLEARFENALRNKQYLAMEKYLLDLIEKQPTNKFLKEKLSILRAHREKTVSEYLKKAQKEFKAGRYFNAKNILDEALQFDPENSELKEKREKALDKIAELNSAQRLETLFTQFLKQGQEALENKEYGDAIIYLNRALSIKPKNKDAFRALKQAVENYTQNVDKPFQEAMRAYKEKRYKEALEKLGLVLTVEPKHPVALKKLTEIQQEYQRFLEDSYTGAQKALKEEKYPQAIKLLQTILQYEPQYKDAAQLLTRAQQDYEEWKKKEHERQLMKLAEPRFKRGVRYMQEGKLTDAIVEFTEAVKIYNKHYKAYYNMGICYDLLGQPEMAIASYQKAIQVNPDFARAYHNLGVVYFMMGKRKEALQNLYKAAELDPNFKKTKELIKIIKKNE